MNTTPHGSSTFFCFEEDWAPTVLKYSLGDGHFYSFTDWITRHTPEFPEESSEIRQQLVQAIDPAFDANTLKTIEVLREAFVLTHDDVDFCFSHLVDTPKRDRLRKWFHAYLESELSQDWTLRVSNIIEQCKNLEFHHSGPPKAIFVKALRSSPLFSEFAQAYKYAKGVQSVRVLYPWELEEATPPKVIRSHCIEALENLTVTVKGWLDSGVELKQIVVPLQAESATERLLEYLWDHHRIPYQKIGILHETHTTKQNKLAQLLQSIRQHSELPLLRRLEIGKRVQEDSALRRLDEDWSVYLEHLLEKRKIEAHELDLLKSIELPSPPSASPSNQERAIQITPFGELPFLGLKSVAFCDNSLFGPPKWQLVLDPEEIDLLSAQGIALTKQTVQHEVLQQAVLQCGHLYADLPQQLAGTLEQRHETTENRPNRTKRSFCVRLPIRPLSATQLETYAKCPTQYLFNNRLKLSPPKHFWEARYPLLFGIAVHAALENYFKERPATVEISGLLGAFSNALLHDNSHLTETHPLYIILLKHFEKMASQIKSMEETLTSMYEHPTPTEFERSFELNLEGLKLRGKIDRIDRLPSGKRLVLDYKTGTVDFTPKHIASGKNFQALLYLLAQDSNDLAGILFYDLKKSELRRGLLIDEFTPKTAKQAVTRGHTLKREAYQKLIEEGIQSMQKLAKEIRSGDFTPKPSIDTCRVCQFGAHCREGVHYE